MNYVRITDVADVVADQAAGLILHFVRHEGSGDDIRDRGTVVSMLWEFNALADRVGRLPKFQIPQPRHNVGEKTRQKIFDRDGNRCLKCGTDERLVEESNFQTLCSPYNWAKGTDAVDYRVSAPVFGFSTNGNSNPPEWP